MKQDDQSSLEEVDYMKWRSRVLYTLAAEILPYLFVNPVHASDFMRANLLDTLPTHRVVVDQVIVDDEG